MQKTANQIKSSFETLASGHYQIHSFLYAQEFEQQAYENLIYPLMLVYPLGGSLSGTTYSRNYRVIIADRVLKSEGNELEVESDTQLIALDVLAYWMKLGQNERFTITSSNTITPFWEKWGDEVTGHFVDIGIEEFYDFNSCAIPLSGSIPTPPNPCKDARISVNSVVYGNAPSDSNFNVVVKDQLGSLVGSLIGSEWIVNTGGSCADATYTIEDSLGNILYTGTIVSGGSLTQAIGNSTLNVNNSAGTLISSESILAEGTDSYNVADSVAVIKDSAGTTLKSENILATASENITINDSVAVIKDSANNTLKSENILAEATENITITDSTAVIKDSIGTTLKTEPILAEASENITISDSLVNVRKSDNVLISAVSVKAENTENYLVADSLIENDATTPTYSQLVKATEGLILPTQEIQNNGVASGFIPSVGTINVTTNAAPTSFTITGRTIDIVVTSGGGSYDIDTIDRFGNVLPTISVSANTTLDWTAYDFAQQYINALSTPPSSTLENAIIDLVDDLIGFGLWEKMRGIWLLNMGTAIDTALNLKYPFANKNSFQLTHFGSPTYNSDGIQYNTSTNHSYTHFDPAMLGNGNYHFGIYSQTNSLPTGAAADIGFTGFGTLTSIFIRDNNTNRTALQLNGSSFATNTNPSSDGHYIANALGTTGKLIKNGSTSLYNVTITNNITFACLSINGTTVNTIGETNNKAGRKYSFAHVGQALTDTEIANLYTAIQTYHTTLGIQK